LYMEPIKELIVEEGQRDSIEKPSNK